MLSVTDNELMTGVSTGTPMGNLIREYWIPFLFSFEIESGHPDHHLFIRRHGGFFLPSVYAEKLPIYVSHVDRQCP
jgi:hypothetical protein